MKRVLILDDSRETRTLVRRMVGDLAEIVEAESVGEAYRILTENPPDAAIVDLVLPTSVMQGDSFAELLWRVGVPAIILTSNPHLAKRNGIPVIEKFIGVRDAVAQLLRVRPVQFGNLAARPSAA